MSAELPKLLVVQARTEVATVDSEQAVINSIARRAGVEPVYINPLLVGPWEGENVLRRGFAGTLWMGSADVDLTVETTAQQLYVDLAMPLAERVLEEELPTMGICLGHEAMAQAAGGTVARVEGPNGRNETGTVLITLTPQGKNEPVLENMPNPFKMIMGHKDSVVDLPPGAVILGETDRDPHSVIRVGSAILFQGHPEITIAKELGERVNLAETNHDKGSGLKIYEQTHPFTRPARTDKLIRRHMLEVRRNATTRVRV